MSLRRSSLISIGSRVTFPFEEEPKYEEMTDEDLRQSLELALRTNKILKLENDVFERYLTRHDPECLITMNHVLESVRHAQNVTSQLVPTPSSMSLTAGGSIAMGSILRERTILSSSLISSQSFGGSRRLTSSFFPPSAKEFRITLSHRIEMTNKEIDEMKRDLSELEKTMTKKRANLRAQMEELELRIRETHEKREELEENIVKKGVDPLTGKIPAEKFVKFMEDWLKTANSIIEKLRLKSSSIKIQIKRAKQQLRRRQELGETLHPIDFQQLAIENEDYLKQIEEKNQYLMSLKKVTARYNIALTAYKRKMNDQISSLTQIRTDIDKNKSQIEKLKNKQILTQVELEKAEKELTKIMQIMDKYEIPEILDFVKVQAELREMRKAYKRLERHRKIQITALRTFKKRQNDLKQRFSSDDSRSILS